MSASTAGTRKGRGATSNRDGRYESLRREIVDDGWGSLGEALPPLKTTVSTDTSRTVMSFNQSPDVAFDRSINPYRGCEHGCIYCYARPTHTYLGLSAGLDFETRLFYKPDASAQLRAELARPGYQCQPIGLGANTDPYQPIERKLEVTRAILEVLEACRHPVRIITKSATIERDSDLIGRMAERRLVAVSISITTLDPALARNMEPRATSPARRLRTVERLSGAGIPVSVLVAPIIPMLNDSELETILSRVRDAGARSAYYSVIRLPLEVRDLFHDWLVEHYPLKADRIFARIRDMRGGKDYDSNFATRMRGSGELADLIAKRFSIAVKRLEFPGDVELDCEQFTPPPRDERQLQLL